MTDIPETVPDQPALMPCPFCGGEATTRLVETYSTDSSYYIIGCKKCSAMMEINNKIPSPQEASEWNRRAASIPLPLIRKVGLLIGDPMWADHVEISKTLLKEIHGVLRALSQNNPETMK
jgi:Lar family restriction alleviation protein